VNARRKRLVALGCLLATLECAEAAQPFTPDYFGYFRAGLGGSEGGGQQTCFALPGTEARWRLGNECDVYGEAGVGGELYQSGSAKVDFKVMLNYLGGASELEEQYLTYDTRRGAVGLRQGYLSVGGLAGGDAAAWFGRRYYQRYDIHPMDFYYWNNSGYGAGIERMDVGLGKLSAAVIRVDGTSGTALDFRLSNIPVNAGGELEMGVDVRFAEQHRGTRLTVQHTQKDFLGGFNRLAVQFGDGAGGAGENNTNSAFPAADQRFTRLLENLVIAPANDVSCLFAFVYQQTKVPGASDQKWVSIGARPMYHWTEYATSAVELSYDQVKYTTGLASGQTGKLAKLTIAPLVLRPGYGPLTRPELRFFVTWADWNNAANGAATEGSLVSDVDFSGGVAGNATAGITIGLQLETWW
jgi:maltoporin